MYESCTFILYVQHNEHTVKCNIISFVLQHGHKSNIDLWSPAASMAHEIIILFLIFHIGSREKYKVHLNLFTFVRGKDRRHQEGEKQSGQHVSTDSTDRPGSWTEGKPRKGQQQTFVAV